MTLTGIRLVLATFALGFAGLLLWQHGYVTGLRWNSLVITHNLHRQNRVLRARVVALEEAARISDDPWTDFDRSGS